MALPIIQKTTASIFSVHSVVLLGLVGVGGFIFLKHLAKKAQAKNTLEFNKFINNNLANILSKKLAIPAENIHIFLNGRNNDDLEEQIKMLVKSVNLILTKEKGNVLIQLTVCYTDDTKTEVSTQRAWEEIPDEKREMFLRTGDNSISFEWDFINSKKTRK